MSRRAKTTTIEYALRILSERTDLRGEDGVATGACMEAAERLAEMRELLRTTLLYYGEAIAPKRREAMERLIK